MKDHLLRELIAAHQRREDEARRALIAAQEGEEELGLTLMRAQDRVKALQAASLASPPLGATTAATLMAQEEGRRRLWEERQGWEERVSALQKERDRARRAVEEARAGLQEAIQERRAAETLLERRERERRLLRSKREEGEEEDLAAVKAARRLRGR